MARLLPAVLLPAILLASCRAHGPAGAPARAEGRAPGAEDAAVAPPRPTLLLARARMLRARGDVPGAREQLEAAQRAAPDDEDVRLELADLLVADGGDLARAAALVAPLRDGAGRRLHLVRGRIADARADDAAAADEYRLALAEEDDPDVRFRRALALERLGRGAEALAELERVHAARPGDGLVRTRLAERFERAGRLPEAEAQYRWLAEAQPERAAGWERLAAFYERIGRPQDARRAAEEAHARARPGRVLRPLLPSKR